MHAKIMDVSAKDGFYVVRKSLIGRTGEFLIAVEKDGWAGGIFEFDVPLTIKNAAPKTTLVVYQIKYINLDGKSAKHIGFWGLTWHMLRLRIKILYNRWTQ